MRALEFLPKQWWYGLFCHDSRQTPEGGILITRPATANISLWRLCQEPPIGDKIPCILEHVCSCWMSMEETASLEGVFTTSVLDDLTDCLAKEDRQCNADCQYSYHGTRVCDTAAPNLRSFLLATASMLSEPLFFLWTYFIYISQDIGRNIK